jgi:hypothetical protein
MKGRDAGENEKFMEREGENVGGRQFRVLSRPVASYLSTRFAVSDGMGSRRRKGEEKGGFSTPLKYGITLEIIARHQRAVYSAVAT